jgi:hypothetical protein
MSGKNKGMPQCEFQKANRGSGATINQNRLYQFIKYTVGLPIVIIGYAWKKLGRRNIVVIRDQDERDQLLKIDETVEVQRVNKKSKFLSWIMFGSTGLRPVIFFIEKLVSNTLHEKYKSNSGIYKPSVFDWDPLGKEKTSEETLEI